MVQPMLATCIALPMELAGAELATASTGTPATLDKELVTGKPMAAASSPGNNQRLSEESHTLLTCDFLNVGML